MPTLEQRVEALERQLAQLGPDESTQERLLTVDSTGHVSATFTGIVSAQGLSLPTAILTTTPASEIEWTDNGKPDPTRSQTEGIIHVFEDISSNPEMDMIVTSPVSKSLILRLLAFIGGAESAEVDIDTKPNDGVNTGIFINAAVPSLSLNASRTLLRANGTSDFLQGALNLADVTNTTGARQNIFAVGGADNSIHNLLGDFALEYAAANAAFGPGTGNPFNSTGIVVAVNDGSRLSGANYIVPNTGIYLVFGSMNYLASGAANAEFGVINASSGFNIKSAGHVPSSLLQTGPTFCSLLSCTAGQTLSPQMSVSAAVTLEAVGVVSGNVTSYWGCGQVR